MGDLALFTFAGGLAILLPARLRVWFVCWMFGGALLLGVLALPMLAVVFLPVALVGVVVVALDA